MLLHLTLISTAMASGALAAAGCTPRPRTTIEACLSAKLSSGATVVNSSSAAPRWSQYQAPQPGTVVNVATENDVAVTVQCANQVGAQFLAQAGGAGWADDFHIGSSDIVINLRGLNSVVFNGGSTQATVGGGTIISELVDAAYANNAEIVTGNCNCVGITGAMLGAGYGHLMGRYGFMVDNVLSMNVVNANGVLETVTPSSDPDLFWAMRGAGPNFGIVTSVIMKSYPTPQSQSSAWTGPLIYAPSKLPQLVEAINNLELDANMSCYLYYFTSGPPSYEPTIAALPTYLGDETTAKQKFASLYAVGPEADDTAVLPYPEINSGGDPFCVYGERKPSYAAATSQLDVSTWVALYAEFVAWLDLFGGAEVGNSAIIMEAFSLEYAGSLGVSSSAYAWRTENRFNQIIIPWYSNPSLDTAASLWGEALRFELQATSGLPDHPVYINFAHGDENLSQVYGSNLPRLQALKAQRDPNNRFNQWFDLSQ